MKVLVIDDNEMNRDIIRRRLERSGFTVLLAETGEQGLKTAKTEMPQAILLDLTLPGITGDETAQKLKADPATSGIKIIIMSGVDEDESRDRAECVGCQDVLPKPLDFQLLISMLSEEKGACP
jgi:CheY-like chemotaxis protein